MPQPSFKLIITSLSLAIGCEVSLNANAATPYSCAKDADLGSALRQIQRAVAHTPNHGLLQRVIDNPHDWKNYQELAWFCERTGRLDAARTVYIAAITCLRRYPPENDHFLVQRHKLMAGMHSALGRLSEKLKDRAQAESNYRLSVQFWPGVDNCRRYAEILEKQNKLDEARPIRHKLRELENENLPDLSKVR